jgi:translocation protein SEC63
VRTYTVQFQAPPSAGLYTFQAILKSDSFVAADATRLLKLRVDDATALEDPPEDDISEPDEDSLAGQMALMKGQPVRPPRTDSASDSATDDDDGDDDDTDSDSDSD